MKRYCQVLSILGIFWCGIISDLKADTLYVRSFKAFLLEKPQGNSTKILTIAQGAAVESLETQGLWVKVAIEGQQGWISKMVLAAQPPTGKVSLLDENSELADSARRRASSFSSTAAARGLTESGRERINSKEGTDFDAVEQLEKQQITETEAIQFIEFEEAR
ncbi:MAG: SH3 domain-containing protein [SAR324 cluster bacterium]|nr:SH3 domain-containing protein [SAR324 cluster bacterium]